MEGKLIASDLVRNYPFLFPFIFYDIVRNHLTLQVRRPHSWHYFCNTYCSKLIQHAWRYFDTAPYAMNWSWLEIKDIIFCLATKYIKDHSKNRHLPGVWPPSFEYICYKILIMIKNEIWEIFKFWLKW